MLNRQQIANIYRPQGPKAISLGNAWASGGILNISNAQVDVSTPLEAIRLVLKVRDVIGTAGMTTPSPWGYLNLIKRVLITGKNSKAGGNVTLWDCDLPTIAAMWSAVKRGVRPWSYFGVSAAGAPGTAAELVTGQPGNPVANFFTGATGTYDIRIAIDIPFFPMESDPISHVGYLLRAQEFADSIQIKLEYGAINAGASGCLGLDAGTTTHTFTAFGSGAGSPTVDVYAIPVIMGVDLDAAHAPGYLTRVATPVTATLQAAGGLNTRLVTLEKRDTTRIFALIGTSTLNPHFLTLSNANLTTLGLAIGGNKYPRENDDIFAHQLETQRQYGTLPIQGMTVFDFMQSGNPDSAYQSGSAGDGTTFELRGTVAGVANALGIFVQETEQYKPAGSLYPA